MAFLNKQERDRLQEDLKGMKFGRAVGKLRGLDPFGRLVYYRNAQQTGELSTRYELKGLGTLVTLVERQSPVKPKVVNFGMTNRNQNEMIDVQVEPTPDNRL